MRLFKTKVWVPAWKVSFVENKFQVNAKLKWDGSRRAVGPVPILKCKIRVWKNGVATELVLFTSPHLTLRGKHTLKEDSSLLKTIVDTNDTKYTVLRGIPAYCWAAVHTAEHFWSKQRTSEARSSWGWGEVSSSYKWKAWGLGDLLSNYSYSW